MPTSQKKICDSLPKYLAERVRFVATANGASDGQFVLYWLHHAMRARENPALDVAILLSNRVALPLSVYQGLPENHPFASDRHHRFVLEGICDLQQQFERRGIQYAIHLQRRNQQDPQLQHLANRAAVVVTDEMPVQPMRGWIDKLGSIANTTVLAVDTACVFPVQVVGRAYDRAFQFRKETASEYQHRISREWSEIEIEHGNAEIELSFNSPVLTEQTIGSLISKCDIDHSIGPVPHTRGGSAAGYARWDQFKRDGLKAYARRRNDPLADATSRLSPYLHFGMVSPLRIAREAAAIRSAGSEKFLDELLI